MSARLYRVFVDYDEEADVWFVTESDVPGLVTEAPTYPELCQKIFGLAPELFELNGHGETDAEVPVEIIAHAPQTHTSKMVRLATA